MVRFRSVPSFSVNFRSFLDFGTASQASILTTLKSDLLNVSKSTSSANNGSIFTLERSICTLGADTVASSAEPFTAAFSALFSAFFGSRVFIVGSLQRDFIYIYLPLRFSILQASNNLHFNITLQLLLQVTTNLV